MIKRFIIEKPLRPRNCSNCGRYLSVADSCVTARFANSPCVLGNLCRRCLAKLHEAMQKIPEPKGKEAFAREGAFEAIWGETEDRGLIRSSRMRKARQIQQDAENQGKEEV